MALIKAIKFDPEKFIGPGWRILNERITTFQLNEVDLEKVILKSYVAPDTILTLRERERSFMSDEVHLGANFFLALWRNKKKIPKSWQEYIYGQPISIYFTGTELMDPFGRAVYLCLVYRDGAWDYDWDWAEHPWVEADKSAIIIKAA